MVEPNYGELEYWLDMGDYIHLRAPNPGLWKTRDGRILHICDMSDAHVQNCVLMMQRNGKGDHPKCLEMARILEEHEEFGQHVDATEAELRRMRRVNREMPKLR